MKIKAFENQDLSELSMIEVAHAMLEQKGKEMAFNELVNEIQDYLEKSDTEIRDRLSRFYTELNTDGSFIPLGNNVWALRSWYAIDEIDEEVVALDELDDEGERPKKKRKKVNAFAADGIDIDYNDDDPEDDDVLVADVAYDDDNPDDEKDEVEAFDVELEEVEIDDAEVVALDVEDEEDEDIEEDVPAEK
ncbi:putative DNA-directed RNA polymerase subunit delta [Lactococcus hodotermopsidis]|uniref:Probable DNA-directed RNA polymerase subunit delta n=1 Tax=Pseudolactococcus hodotermopsidis TaxID=2709157 RepID=A0A6A0BEX8_9LACT|nr:DNA-directed RNA polymerase subunit delta [Lactococcus hodotermopsidis]GFH42397.1 putative DNA-directed RNA polymerase subunit delta [Lactococcus hodotermopsidis]